MKNKNSGFINFCFSLSFTILVFLFGWPYMVLYELGYRTPDNIFTIGPIAAGVVVNIIILFILGVIVDKWRKRKGFLPKKYYLRLPLFLIIISVLLFAISLIDKSCA